MEDGKNRPLCQQEQALLIGFINNLLIRIARYNEDRFYQFKGRFTNAYLKNRKAVIGVDEATDYSLIDYYAIYSLRNHLVSSVTLSGDMMQSMNAFGIKDWKKLEDPLLFNKIDIKHLRNRSAINPDEDNSGAINRCEETIKIANGYLAELEEKKASLSIYAEEDGKVINVSDRAISGVLSSTDNLITIASGDDTYFLETKESTTLKEGDVVQAYSYIVSYDAKVEKVERSSAGSKIYFKIINSDEEMTIERGLKVTVAEEVKKEYNPEVCEALGITVPSDYEAIETK